MNITFICPFYYPNSIGGSEVSIKILAEWLASNGFDIQVISFDGKSDNETINGVMVRRYPVISARGLSLTLVYPALRAMRKFEEVTDIYHVYDVYPIVGAGLYKMFRGKRPVIATLNNYAGFCPVVTGRCSACNKFKSRMRCLYEEASALEKPLVPPFAAIYPALTALAKRVDRYIALSSNVVELYTKYNFDPSKITVIPNFINTEGKKCDRMRHINGRFNILYVGAISEYKGVDVLIRAFGMIQTENVNAHLTLVGNGKMISYCKSLVKKLEIDDKVTFRGYIENDKLQEIYADADVFVHPARLYEPFGRSIIEALSYGVPCIVSDTTSPELVNNAGLIFKNEDVEDLAKKLNIFIKEHDFQSRLIRNCFDVIKRYDIDLVGAKIADLYHELYLEHNSS